VHLAKSYEPIYLGRLTTGKTKLNANLHCRDEMEGQMPRLKVGNVRVGRICDQMMGVECREELQAGHSRML
jgi:hypothetical protein